MKRPLLLLCLLCLSGSPATADTGPPGHALASAHPAATEAGLEILNAGGNAFDAAIAVSAVLGVVEPYGSGLGGGGFFLLHDSTRNYTTMLDARERAPLAAHRDLYLDADGNVDRDRALNGPLAAGIPGIAAAWGHLAKHYGQLPLTRTLEPAIRHARDGVPLNPKLERAMTARAEVFLRYPASSIFAPDSPALSSGKRVVQTDLASTLNLLVEQGTQAFYRGPLAETLVAEVRDNGGIWSRQDLEQYQVAERDPITIQWRDAEIVTVAPPSATGVMLAQIFHMLGDDWLDGSDHDDRIHRLIEALRRAYLERAKHLGDPDHVDVPVQRLTSMEYARKLMEDFDPERATRSKSLYATEPEAGHTTHFSILDRDGNWVSATLSINGLFGSGFVVPGTGVLLNNEMDDFSAKPGAPNLYGLIGSEANAIAPGKRMLSSMAPTAVYHANTLALLGTPGGSRITTMVMQGILQFLQGADAESLVTSPRLHHQALPDKVFIEPDMVVDRERLEAKGHTFEVVEPWGNMQVVVWNIHEARLDAASDPRGIGSAKVEVLYTSD